MTFDDMERTDTSAEREKWQVVAGILAASAFFLLLFNVNITPRSSVATGGVTEAPVSQPAPSGTQMVGGC